MDVVACQCETVGYKVEVETRVRGGVFRTPCGCKDAFLCDPVAGERLELPMVFRGLGFLHNVDSSSRRRGGGSRYSCSRLLLGKQQWTLARGSEPRKLEPL